MCASQLSDVFSKLFTCSLRDCTVPKIWKQSTICPVPKNGKPASLNDYRPVALTSIVMKCFERIILNRLLTYAVPHLDPYQFAYKHHRSITEASQKHTRRYIDTFTQHTHSPWKLRFIRSYPLHWLHLPSILSSHISWPSNTSATTLTQNNPLDCPLLTGFIQENSL